MPKTRKTAISDERAKGHIGTQEIRIDLSGNAPVVFIDGKRAATTIELTYRKPPASPLEVEKVWLKAEPVSTDGREH